VASTQDALYRRIDLDLSWSERELPERERTKHVHRLHPYLGKFIPQLVEALLERNVPGGGRVLDPFAGSGDDARAGAGIGPRRVRCGHRAVQLPADAREDARVQPVRARVGAADALARLDRFELAGRRAALALRARLVRAAGGAELLFFRALSRTTSTPTCCASCSRARRGRRGDDALRPRLPATPQRTPYWCHKHRRECRPVASARHSCALRARHARADEGVRARARARAGGGRAPRRRAELDFGGGFDGVVTSPPYPG
jgi:hypothetical protein